MHSKKSASFDRNLSGALSASRVRKNSNTSSGCPSECAQSFEKSTKPNDPYHPLYRMKFPSFRILPGSSLALSLFGVEMKYDFNPTTGLYSNGLSPHKGVPVKGNPVSNNLHIIIIIMTTWHFFLDPSRPPTTTSRSLLIQHISLHVYSSVSSECYRLELTHILPCTQRYATLEFRSFFPLQ